MRVADWKPLVVNTTCTSASGMGFVYLPAIGQPALLCSMIHHETENIAVLLLSHQTVNLEQVMNTGDHLHRSQSMYLDGVCEGLIMGLTTLPPVHITLPICHSNNSHVMYRSEQDISQMPKHPQ